MAAKDIIFDTRARDAVFGNVGTMMSFKVGAEDAACDGALCASGRCDAGACGGGARRSHRDRGDG